MLKSNLVRHGDMVITDWQSAGKGNRGSTWESAPKQNLTFSVVLAPKAPVDELFTLNIASAIAIKETVEQLTRKHAYIKWPNDIYINDKKISGILIETTIKAGLIENAVVGIGLNVNQIKFSYSGATSLASVLGQVIDKKEVLKAFKEKFEFRYNQCADHKTLLWNTYIKSLYKKDKLSLFKTKRGMLWASVSDIDEKGRLILSHGDESLIYQVKEISLIR